MTKKPPVAGKSVKSKPVAVPEREVAEQHPDQIMARPDGYYWRTAGDNAVRDAHSEVDGQFFYWDNPPAIGTIDGEPVNPGEDIQCRCVADPAIDKFLESLPDEE